MACASSSYTCPVCLDNLVDTRLLPCLHSVCKTCVDKMLVTATDENVKCPICRATVTLPSGGAASLPKDVTLLEASAGGGEGSACALCDDDNTSKKPTTWCRTCRLAFCDEHVVPHMVSAGSDGEIHNVVLLSLTKQESSTESAHIETVVPKCPRHNEPLKFHCGSCDVAICGDCTAIGDHQGHKPVSYIKDIVDERKQQVAEKVDKLESDFTRKSGTLSSGCWWRVDGADQTSWRGAHRHSTSGKSNGAYGWSTRRANGSRSRRLGGISYQSSGSATGWAERLPWRCQTCSSIQRANHAANRRKRCSKFVFSFFDPWRHAQQASSQLTSSKSHNTIRGWCFQRQKIRIWRARRKSSSARWPHVMRLPGALWSTYAQLDKAQGARPWTLSWRQTTIVDSPWRRAVMSWRSGVQLHAMMNPGHPQPSPTMTMVRTLFM